MANLTDEDFTGLDAAGFEDVLATGYGPAGEPGTSEHAANVADALGYAGGDIYYDYEQYAETDGYPLAAADHANISSLQSAASYAADVMKALAANPDLLARVQAEIEAARPLAPKL